MKLPAAVAFPTDERLLQRLEQSRRALPPNSIKPLTKRGLAEPAPARPSAAPAPVERWPLREQARSTPPTLVRIEELYARSRLALGQH